jgi:peptidoglycan/LPS O-acetylase OafA/YrhL
MIIFIVLLLFLVLYQCKPRFDRGFYEDYASRNQTLAINGIFITLILLSHTFAKVNSGDVFDRLYEPMRVFLGQFVVVPFLFYSGYGIMESLSKKEGYLKTFSKNRFLKIFMQFSVITLVYIVMHLLLNSEYSWLKIVLSFTGNYIDW